MLLKLLEESTMSDLRFLLDENIPKDVKRFLESKGFSAEYGPKGIKNSRVALLSKDKKSALLSRDYDFLNTTMFPPGDFFGIVVFRIHPPDPEKIISALSMLLEEVSEFKGKLFEVEEVGFKVIED